MTKYQRQISIKSGHRGRYVTASTVSAVCAVSHRTAERYLARRELPTAARRLLEYELLGILPDPAWAGFHVESGALVTPSGRRLAPGQVEWIELVYQLAAVQGLNDPGAASPI